MSKLTIYNIYQHVCNLFSSQEKVDKYDIQFFNLNLDSLEITILRQCRQYIQISTQENRKGESSYEIVFNKYPRYEGDTMDQFIADFEYIILDKEWLSTT